MSEKLSQTDDDDNAEQRLADGFKALAKLAKSAARGSELAQVGLDTLRLQQLAEIAVLEAQLKLSRTRNNIQNLTLPISSEE